MFAIIVSEKGGAERRESFDKNEINVGRVQGNDLVLPKGNVSKHHARLLFRDGRFIVTDLKSTNGTYVNGRKIAQATIVREGDKIYVGDFVLRLEAQEGVSEDSGAEAPREEGPAFPRPGEGGPRPFGGAPSPPVAMPEPPARMAPPPAAAPSPTTAPPMPVGAPLATVKSNQVIGAPSRSPAAPAAPSFDPPEDQERRPSGMPEAPRAAPPTVIGPGGARPPTMPINRTPGASVAPPPVTKGRPGGSMPPPAVSPAAPPVAKKPRPEPRRQPAERTLALQALLTQIGQAVDLSPLGESPDVSDEFSRELERVARERASAMQKNGEAPEGIDVELLVRDAHLELTALGVIGTLLDDDDVSEIHCARFDQVLAVRDGVPAPVETAFSGEEALFRVIARLAAQSGEPWEEGETIIERRHPKAQMLAIVPPTAPSSVLALRKRRRVQAILEDLTREGKLSPAMSTFLETCVQARANVFVSGMPGADAVEIVAALAAAAEPGERVAIVQDAEEIHLPHAHVIPVSLLDTRARGEEAVHAAARIRPERLVVTHLAGQVATATIEEIGEGIEGVLALVPSPSLRHAASRLVSQLVLTRPGLALEAARDTVSEAFDVAVEVSLSPDNKTRITRIAEFAGADSKSVVLRDLFTYSDAEAVFSPTGTSPRLGQEFAARGLRLDPALFRKK